MSENISKQTNLKPNRFSQLLGSSFKWVWRSIVAAVIAYFCTYFLDLTFSLNAFEKIGVANETGSFEKTIHDDTVYKAVIDRTYRLENNMTISFYYRYNNLQATLVDDKGNSDFQSFGNDLSAQWRSHCPAISVRLMQPQKTENKEIVFMYTKFENTRCE